MGEGGGEGGGYQGGHVNITDWLLHVNMTKWLHTIATEGDGVGRGVLQGLTLTTEGVGLGYRQTPGQGPELGLGSGSGQQGIGKGRLGQKLNVPGDIIVFYDVRVYETSLGPLPPQTYSLGDVAVSLRELLHWLPDTLEHYPWPYATAVTVMFNASSAHSIVAFRGEAIAAAFQQCYDQALANGTSSSTSPPPSSLSTSSLHQLPPSNITYVAKNHPLPLTATQAIETRLEMALLASVFVLVPLCYIPGSFVTVLIKERVSKAKLIQMVSSVSPMMYWLSAYLWDVG